MNEIKAYIKQHKLNEVISELKKNHVIDISISHVTAVGWHHNDMKMYKDIENHYHVNEIVKLEIICSSHDTKYLIETIRKHAFTGKPGDGIIFVSDIRQAVKIRTGETGRKALQ
jgi:nitrogen regulatory protein P-II 1